MRILDRFISFVFSLAIIVLAVSVILVSSGVIQYGVVDGILTGYVFNASYKVTVILTSLLVVLAGLKVTIFSSTLSSGRKKNIFVNTPNGKIQIAQETIEGIAKAVISEYDEVKDVKAAMTKAKKGINLYMALVVHQNVNITNIVSKVQEEVKQQIENITGVKVYNVDVRVKNATTPQAPTKTANTLKTENDVKVEATTAEKIQSNVNSAIDEAQVSDNQAQPEGYLRDENGVLYTVEPNNNETKNN